MTGPSPRILALETSGFAGGIAFLEGKEVVAELDLPAGQRTAQTLAPSIKAEMARVGWAPSQIDLVAVTVGPGSFTGLRIGVATAKAFAYATGASVVGINTLEAIVHLAPSDTTEACVVMDAYRNQLFAADFLRNNAQQWRTLVATQVIDTEQWLAAHQAAAVVLGPAAAKLRSRLPAKTAFLEGAVCQPRARMVGELALLAWTANQLDDVWRLVPRYYRPSAAEEKRLTHDADACS